VRSLIAMALVDEPGALMTGGDDGVCIRVLMTSAGNVAIQLAGPARAPASSIPYHGTAASSTSASFASDPEYFEEGGGSLLLLKLRLTASYYGHTVILTQE
jgi:hypothetical protein